MTQTFSVGLNGDIATVDESDNGWSQEPSIDITITTRKEGICRVHTSALICRALKQQFPALNVRLTSDLDRDILTSIVDSVFDDDTGAADRAAFLEQLGVVFRVREARLTGSVLDG